ncbi:MAG: porphobilinogen synthase [Planctomycetota bacterium]|nr:porphobilinogen synthase [Planctomycetota bacterium]
MAIFPVRRMRRRRRNSATREILAESHLTRHNLVQPLFVCDGEGIDRPIDSLAGQFHHSTDRIGERALKVEEAGVPAVLLFGVPDQKDARGSGSIDPMGVIPRAIREIKQRAPDLLIIADVCLCEFTDHGHCGIVIDSEDGSYQVDNDATLEVLAKQSTVFAQAGCDIVAPSAMADGQVQAIRTALDGAGHDEVMILSYAAKYASAFYGPFREAAGSTPAGGDRLGYQMDPRNSREALQEVALDLEEGADMVMVKPGLPYLDIVSKIHDSFDVPVATYHVSGEWAQLHAAADRGWIDLDQAYMESLHSFRRAGASFIITYGAERAARQLGARG